MTPSLSSSFSTNRTSTTPTLPCLQPPGVSLCAIEKVELIRGTAQLNPKGLEDCCSAGAVEYTPAPLVLLPQLPPIVSAVKTLQIVAPAKTGANLPRDVTALVYPRATCDAAEHPAFSLVGDSTQGITKGVHQEFFRRSSMLDLPPLLQSFVWDSKPECYQLRVRTCGVTMTPGAPVVEEVSLPIEVFQADQCELRLSLPLRPMFSAAKYGGAWKHSDEAKDAAGIARVQSDLREAKQKEQRADEAIRLPGTPFNYKLVRDRIDARERVSTLRSDLTKKLRANQFAAELTVRNGKYERDFDLEWIKDVYDRLRDAEDTLRAINHWINELKELQAGFGASGQVQVSLFELAAGVSWGYRETADAPGVHFAIAGFVECNLIALKISGSFGFTSAKMADLVLSLSGEGKLGLSAECDFRNPRGLAAGTKVEPSGSFTAAAELNGSVLLGVVAVGGKHEIEFTATCHEVELFAENGPVGCIRVAHSALTYAYVISMRGIAIKNWRGEAWLKRNERFLEFDLSKRDFTVNPNST